MNMGRPTSTDSRGQLAQALLGAPLPQALTDAEGLAMAKREGVLPLLEAALRVSPQWPELPQDFRNALQAEVRQAIGLDLFRRHELSRVAAALAAGGLRVLLLKGNALGLWLYPQPHLRVTRDIDLLFASRAEADRAVDLLSPLGYVAEPNPGRLFFERKSKLLVDGSSRGELDLHCKLLNAPLFSEVFPFDVLWTPAMALPGLPPTVRALAPVHALLHACLNRALDIQAGEPERLKLAWDVHLLVSRLAPHEWEQLLAVAREKRIAGACMRMFDETRALFATPFPPPVLSGLQAAMASEPLDWARLQDWPYMQWQNCRALPSLALRLRWLYERLFPTTSRLRGRYGDGSRWRLLLRRFLRGVRLLHRRGPHEHAR
ncbi:MAG: nucleotidyltransferase family protein [Thermomonas haemolytica]